MRLGALEPLALGLAAVLGVGLLGGAGWFWYATLQRQAAAVHEGALAQAAKAQRAEATPEVKLAALAALEAALASEPGASSAAQTAHALGTLRLDLKRYAPARAAFEIALAKEPPPTLRLLARAGLGYAWEAEGDYARAADAFQAAVSGLRPREFMFETLTLDLARAQERAGRTAEAIATYQRLLQEAPGTQRADDIRTRLASLTAAKP